MVNAMLTQILTSSALMLSNTQTTVAMLIAAFIVSACTDGNRQQTQLSQVSQPSETSTSVPTHVREHTAKLVPQDAIDLIDTTEMFWIQQTFEVSRKPFDFAISAEQLTRARSDGWIICQELAPEWEGFYDATVTPQRYVRQKVYMLYKQGALLTLIGRYYGTSQIALDLQLGETSNVTQHAIVKGQEATQAELDEAAESFGLSCDQTVPVR